MAKLSLWFRMPSLTYQKLLDWIEQLETIAGIRRGLEDIEPSRTRPFEEFGQEIRKDSGRALGASA